MNQKFIKLWDAKTKEDEWWSSFVTSPVAIILNYFVIDIKWLTPNLITLFSFITAVVSCLFMIKGDSVSFIVAAVLIHFSHILDCMDGQMARYRKSSSLSGDFYDKSTDQIQVTIWFGSLGYAAYCQSQDILPVMLALIGIAFYSLRGYAKYIAIHIAGPANRTDADKSSNKHSSTQKETKAGLGCGFLANMLWFIKEQRKIILFNEGVFIFMLSFALLFDKLIHVLWVFAISQLFYGLFRVIQRGINFEATQYKTIEK